MKLDRTKIFNTTLVISIMLNAILFSVIGSIDSNVVEKEVIKEVVKIEKIYVDEFDNEVSEPIDEEYNGNKTYWYYSYECLDGVVGYGTSETSNKHFNYSEVVENTRKLLEIKYKKDYSFIKFHNITQINKADYEYSESEEE